jgi:hypothetical protein
MPENVDTKKTAAERRSALTQRLGELEAERTQLLSETEEARAQAEGEHTRAVEAAQQAYNEVITAERHRLVEEFGTAEEKYQALAKFAEPKSAELAEQVRELDAKRDRDLQALRAKVREMPDYQRLVAETEAAEQQIQETLSARIVNDVHAAVGPLAEQYVATLSRDLPEKIARAFFNLDLRAKRDLGAELNRDLVLTTFIDAILKKHPNALSAISQRQLYGSSIWGSFDKGARPIMRALFELVDILETAAEQPGTEPSSSMLELYEIRKTSATDAQRRQREAALRAEQDERRQRAIAASNVPLARSSPPPPPFAPPDRPPVATLDRSFEL